MNNDELLIAEYAKIPDGWEPAAWIERLECLAKCSQYFNRTQSRILGLSAERARQKMEKNNGQTKLG